MQRKMILDNILIHIVLQVKLIIQNIENDLLDIRLLEPLELVLLFLLEHLSVLLLLGLIEYLDLQ